MKTFFLGLFLSLLLDTHAFSFKEDEWDYKEKGPETGAWCKVSAICCNGERQSPFVLRPAMYRSKNLEDFELIDYDKEIELMGLNNGKTVVFTIKDSNTSPMIGGADMDSMYKFHSIQFHWGDKNTSGSEHAMFGPRAKADLEVHLIHYKAKFNTYEEAIKSKEKDALAILAILYGASRINKFDVLQIFTDDQSTAITTIVNSLPNIIKPGQTTTVAIKLTDLYGKITTKKNFEEKNDLTHYMGSLTAPPCYEIVRWYILTMRTRISEDEVDVFRKLEGKDSVELSNNFRPLNKQETLPILKKSRKGKKTMWIVRDN